MENILHWAKACVEITPKKIKHAVPLRLLCDLFHIFACCYWLNASCHWFTISTVFCCCCWLVILIFLRFQFFNFKIQHCKYELILEIYFSFFLAGISNQCDITPTVRWATRNRMHTQCTHLNLPMQCITWIFARISPWVKLCLLSSTPGNNLLLRQLQVAGCLDPSQAYWPVHK